MWIITRARDADDEAGQASVELLALLPALGLIIALAFQALLAGETWWLASVAAREGARASALGRDPVAAASSAVPSSFRSSHLVVSTSDDDASVTVTLPIPLLIGGLRVGSAVGHARMEPQR